MHTTMYVSFESGVDRPAPHPSRQLILGVGANHAHGESLGVAGARCRQVSATDPDVAPAAASEHDLGAVDRQQAVPGVHRVSTYLASSLPLALFLSWYISRSLSHFAPFDVCINT